MYICYIVTGFLAAITNHGLLLFLALPLSAFFLGMTVAEEDYKQKPKQRQCCCQSPDEWCWENNK